MMRMRSALFALLLVMLTAMFAGCGQGRAARHDLILFGATISITGKTAKEGEYTRDGYMMFVESINEQGGIMVGGRRYRVALRYYDDESRPERAAELYEKLINVDRVDFLLGPYGSGPTSAAARLAEQYAIPLVEGSGAADTIFTSDHRYTFGVLTPASAYLHGIIDLAADAGLRTVAILGSEDSFAVAVAAGAAAHAITRGMQVVYQASYPASAQDITPLLTRLRPLDPDLLLGAGHLQDALLIVRQARALGLAPRALGFSVGPSTPEFRKNLRSAADYVLGATQWTPALNYRGDDLWQTPAGFAEAFKQRYPHYLSVPYTVASSAAVFVTYQQAIERAGRLDRAAVRDALATLKINTFYGPIAFDRRGSNSDKPMAVEQILPDGSYTVYPLLMAERPAVIPVPARGMRNIAPLHPAGGRYSEATHLPLFILRS